jgi:hypothetical protein
LFFRKKIYEKGGEFCPGVKKPVCIVVVVLSSVGDACWNGVVDNVVKCCTLVPINFYIHFCFSERICQVTSK